MEEIKRRAETDAKTYGYYLHPDPEFLKSLLEGLKENWDRYGYMSCPCRLASGRFKIDRDILCPCDYRDPDVLEYGACYCALYVRKDLYEGQTPVEPVPERRPLEKQMRAYKDAQASSAPTAEAPTQVDSKPVSGITLKLWYCRQCGYTAFREDPPYICPICKAKREMFSEIRISTVIQP